MSVFNFFLNMGLLWIEPTMIRQYDIKYYLKRIKTIKPQSESEPKPWNKKENKKTHLYRITVSRFGEKREGRKWRI